MSETFKIKHITFTTASKRACEEAHQLIGYSHYWGNKDNAGKNYKPKKRKK